MRRVRVERGDARAVAPAVQQHQPMCWAENKSSSKPVYIGWLSAEQNGNACGCKCPACGEDLQAVNVDKDKSHFRKSNTRGMFFRHPSGHERKNCSFLTAKLAALHLLMERDEIDLPPPRKERIHQGASDTIYTGKKVGRAFCGRITNKVWVDSQSARITIDGRTVLVQLHAQPNFSSEVALDGVITIQVNDPIVASWEPHQILAALKLDTKFSCWEKHWDDDKLDAEAERIATAAADDAMDYIFPELGPLDGFTTLQKSETILHAKVKEILSKAGRLKVPCCEQEVTRVMYDGSHERRHVRFASQHFTLSQVRLETPLQGLIPDVVCIAQSRRNPSESFTLLIEVAVTHRVDAGKRALIAAHNLACVEIDLTQLVSHQRRITVDQLQSAVTNDVQGKRWIFNPFLVDMVKAKELDLEREDQKRKAAWQREQERQQWLNDCNTQGLIGLFLPALKHHWLTETPLMVDDKYEVLPQEIAEKLVEHGFKDANDPLLLKNDGLLSCLEDIQNRYLSGRSPGRWGGLWRFEQEPTLQNYVTLGLMAVRIYPLSLSPEDMQRVNSLRDKVKDSLNREESKYARPTIHDKIIEMLYPPMRDLLSMPFGTLKALQEKIEARRAMERKKTAEMARIEAQKAAEVRREAELTQEKRRKEQEEESRRREKINDLLSRELTHSWSTGTSVDAIEPVLKRRRVIRLIGNYARSGMDVEAILKSAWSSRVRGESFRQWFSQQSVPDTAKAKMLLEVLRAADMVP